MQYCWHLSRNVNNTALENVDVTTYILHPFAMYNACCSAQTAYKLASIGSLNQIFKTSVAYCSNVCTVILPHWDLCLKRNSHKWNVLCTLYISVIFCHLPFFEFFWDFSLHNVPMFYIEAKLSQPNIAVY